MRVHDQLIEIHEPILANAKKVSLDILDYSKTYYLTKIKNKRTNESCKDFVLRGNIVLTGNLEFVTLYISNISEWFRTSPVVSTKAKGSNFIIETENSVYLLETENR